MKDTKQVKAYKEDLERIKRFGKMGDTMAQALHNALDKAEGKL
jgi:hypothetical protein